MSAVQTRIFFFISRPTSLLAVQRYLLYIVIADYHLGDMVLVIVNREANRRAKIFV